MLSVEQLVKTPEKNTSHLCHVHDIVQCRILCRWVYLLCERVATGLLVLKEFVDSVDVVTLLLHDSFHLSVVVTQPLQLLVTRNHARLRRLKTTTNILNLRYLFIYTPRQLLLHVALCRVTSACRDTSSIPSQLDLFALLDGSPERQQSWVYAEWTRKFVKDCTLTSLVFSSSLRRYVMSVWRRFSNITDGCCRCWLFIVDLPAALLVLLELVWLLLFFAVFMTSSTVKFSLRSCSSLTHDANESSRCVCFRFAWTKTTISLMQRV